ncbi:MAG TPA: VCBS repeat-containing protein [Candidatus Dormibacteraeota bacterium]|nr:VCBS repeat-containing protein [Candidatus Dormibacteraeota bacterium]
MLSCKYHSITRATKVASLVLCLLAAWANRAEAAIPSQSARAFSPRANLDFAIADFDGDRRPDLATVEIETVNWSTARYSIRFQLSGGAGQAIGVTAALGGLQITSRDVNGDDALDLVVATTWLHQPVTILLNDGHGKFNPSDPSGFPAFISEPETHLRPVTCELKDLAVLLGARCGAGECGERTGLLLPPPLPGVSALLTSRFKAVIFHHFFSSRAPPTFASLV